MTFPLTWQHIIDSRSDDAGNDHAELAALRSFYGEDPMALPLAVFERVLNSAPWTYEWIVWFLHSLDHLKDARGYDNLCAELRDRDKFRSAWTVLQVAERMHAAGLEVAFDIPVLVDGRTKVPDLMLLDIDTGAPIYTEVSVMFTAQKHMDASIIFDRIVNLFLEFHDDLLTYAGRVLRPIAIEEVEGLAGRVRLEILEVRRDRSFREVTLGDVLTIAMAPEALQERVDRWATDHEFEPGSFGAALPPIDQFMRLHGKVELEAKQLPGGQPNLLVIWAQSLFVTLPNPVALLPYIAQLIEAHPKIALLVIVFEGYSSAPTARAEVGENLIVASKRDGVDHQYIIVPNPAATARMPSHMLDKFREAFSL